MAVDGPEPSAADAGGGVRVGRRGRGDGDPREGGEGQRDGEPRWDSHGPALPAAGPAGGGSHTDLTNSLHVEERVIVGDPGGQGFRWTDVEGPTDDEIRALYARFGLPAHLPVADEPRRPRLRRA